jgi:multidrug efflux pump subunit AcrA (membrane-fusion protein)
LRRRSSMRLLGAVLVLVMLGGIAGCGDAGKGAATPVTPLGQTKVTVVATSGSISQQTVVTINVQ